MTHKFDFKILTRGEEFSLQVWHRGLGMGVDTEISECIIRMLNATSKTPRELFNIPGDGEYEAYGEGLYNSVTKEVGIQNCTAQAIG